MASIEKRISPKEKGQIFLPSIKNIGKLVADDHVPFVQRGNFTVLNSEPFLGVTIICM